VIPLDLGVHAHAHLPAASNDLTGATLSFGQSKFCLSNYKTLAVRLEVIGELTINQLSLALAIQLRLGINQLVPD
jgi:hypothetical protein